MEIITLVFILSSTLIILTPGQDMILVMSRSVSQGQKAGIITAFGVWSGNLNSYKELNNSNVKYKNE